METEQQPIKNLKPEDLPGIEMVCQEQMRVIARTVAMSIKNPIYVKPGLFSRLLGRKPSLSEEQIEGISLLVKHCTLFVHWVNYLVSSTRIMCDEKATSEQKDHARELYENSRQEIDSLVNEIQAADYGDNGYAPSALWQINFLNQMIREE